MRCLIVTKKLCENRGCRNIVSTPIWAHFPLKENPFCKECRERRGKAMRELIMDQAQEKRKVDSG